MRNRIHNLQLAALRKAARSTTGRVLCDESTGKALVDRGFATGFGGDRGTRRSAGIFITMKGRERAKFKAGYRVDRDGQPFDPSTMEDLPEAS